MRALVLGMDGYLGWPLTCTLVDQGHEVMGMESGLRRKLVEDERSISAIRILPLLDRINVLNDIYKSHVGCIPVDLADDYNIVLEIIKSFQPEVVFHLAQIPSAPFSMRNRANCLFTHKNNVHGTLNLLYAVKEGCPDAHIIKIGTMGEYGTPDIPIPEGGAVISIGENSAYMPFPRMAGSWYHQTKVHDTHNIRMACDMWGLRCTDIMQGIVYGSRVKAMRPEPGLLATRLDFDQCFGTIINRFVVQAVSEHPLTVYGLGTQTRSILPLQDSINCMMLLALKPVEKGRYREVNQFHEYMSLNEMAEIVSDAYTELTGNTAKISHFTNPRFEKEKHFYQPIANILRRLGYENSECIQKVVRCMIVDTFENRTKLRDFHSVINPTVAWTGDMHQANEIHEN